MHDSDENHIERWPQKMCADLSKAAKWEMRDGSLLHAVGKLVRQNCPDGAALTRPYRAPDGFVNLKITPTHDWNFVPKSSIWEKRAPEDSWVGDTQDQIEVAAEKAEVIDPIASALKQQQAGADGT